MIIVLNGPLGIGKSTLAESLMERIDGCAMLDGDHLVALHPEPDDAREHLHGALALLVEHHRRIGIRHFVIDHYWDSADALADLQARLCEDGEPFHCFLLMLPEDENLRRIETRQKARAIDERAFERGTVVKERAALFERPAADVGEPFDVSDPPDVLALRLIAQLGID